MFEDFLTAAGAYLGTTSTNAGIVLGLFITIILVFLSLYLSTSSKERIPVEMIAGIMSFLSIIFFTMLSWFPMWFGATMGFFCAVALAYYVSKSGG